MEDAKKQAGKPKKVEVKSWYKDKSFALTVQRNVLLIISILLFISIIISLITIKTIVEKRSVEPYVIKVSKQEQIPVSVSIESVRNFTSAQAGVLEYFLVNYIVARESYNFATYVHDYFTLVKRMSTGAVFQSFETSVNDPLNGVLKTLGKISTMDVTIKQIALESKNNIIVVRISKRIIRNGDVKSVTHYKIKMHYMLDVSNLSYKDIVLNPLGLKIDFYEVIEEKAIASDTNYKTI